jgi:hypothetical protein
MRPVFSVFAAVLAVGGQLMLDVGKLIPFRLEIGSSYDSAFFYLSNRGPVAERWAHTQGFGRHTLSFDTLRLTNTAGSRFAEAALKTSRFAESAPELDWTKALQDGADFVTDCLTAFQPERVLLHYADVRLYAAAPSFDAVRNAIASRLLKGEYAHPPTSGSVFDDLTLVLTARQTNLVVTTVLGPMRRDEVDPQVDGEVDLESFPESLLFVGRRYELRAGANLRKDRFELESAKTRLASLVEDHLKAAPSEVSSYVASLLGNVSGRP